MKEVAVCLLLCKSSIMEEWYSLVINTPCHGLEVDVSFAIGVVPAASGWIDVSVGITVVSTESNSGTTVLSREELPKEEKNVFDIEFIWIFLHIFTTAALLLFLLLLLLDITNFESQWCS